MIGMGLIHECKWRVCVCVPCSTPTHYPMWFFFFADSSSSLPGQELAGLRVILGVFEAGYFPGAVYLLSTWFVRYDVGKRYAVFYMIGSLASAVSGILVSFEKKENMNMKKKIRSTAALHRMLN